MKNILIYITIAVFLTSCSVANYQSKHEARTHYAEKQRQGLLSKDEYRKKIAEVNNSDLKEKSEKKLDYKEIRSFYQREASGDKAAAITRGYNSGRINKSEYLEHIQKNKNNKAAMFTAGALMGLGAAYGGVRGGYGTVSGGIANSLNKFPSYGNSYTGNKYKYDPKTGNSYSYNTDSLGVTHVRGNNLRTGSSWNNTIQPNGDMRGYDSKMNPWSSNKATGSYYNYGTGRSCYGKGMYRECY